MMIEIKKREEESLKWWKLLVVLLLVVIIAGGIYIYNNQDETVINNNSNTINLMVTDELVNSAMINLVNYANFNSVAYTEGNAHVAELDSYQLLSYAAYNIFLEKYDVDTFNEVLHEDIYSVEDFNESLKNNKLITSTLTSDDISELFDDSYDFEIPVIFHYSVEGNFGGVLINTTDNPDEFKITWQATWGSEGPISSFTHKVITKAEISGDYLYVYENVAFAKLKEFTGTEASYQIFRDTQLTEMLFDDVYFSANSINMNLIDVSKYDTYKYSFKKIDGNYMIESIEKVEID